MKMFDIGLCILAVVFSVALTYFMTHKTCHECINESDTQPQSLFKIVVANDK